MSKLVWIMACGPTTTTALTLIQQAQPVQVRKDVSIYNKVEKEVFALLLASILALIAVRIPTHIHDTTTAEGVLGPRTENTLTSTSSRRKEPTNRTGLS